jgi:hypothetical protein
LAVAIRATEHPRKGQPTPHESALLRYSGNQNFLCLDSERKFSFCKRLHQSTR